MSFSEWKKYKLEEVTQFIGRGISPSYKESDGLVVINQRCIRDGKISLKESRFHDPNKKKIGEEKRLKKFDILINSTGTGTLGRVGQFLFENDNCTVDSHVTIVRPVNTVNPEFLSYYLKNKQNDIENLAEGSTGQTELPRKSVVNLNIVLPSIKTQQKIASILTALDDKIELNRQTNQTLEAMAQTLFKEMCLPKGDMLEDGWRVAAMEDLVETVSVTHKMKQEKIIFLNTSDILEGSVLNNDYSIVSSLPGQAKKSIKRNDILFSEIRPANKRYAFVNFDADDYVVSTKLMVLRSKGLVSPYLLYCFLTSSDTLRELQHLAETRSGTFPQITFTQLKNFKILIPDDVTLKKVTKNIKDIFENIFLINKEIQTLTKLRDSLLPRLMKGEIELNN